MATAYPLAPPKSTRVRPLNRPPIEAMEDGSLRGQSIAAATLFEIEITHSWATNAELATLRAFVAANRAGEIDVPASDGRTYRGRWADRDYTERARRGGMATVSIRLYGAPP